MTKKECNLEEEIFVDLGHGSTPFDIFQTVTGMNKLLEIIVTKTNIYAIQKTCNFETTKDVMKAFVGINFIIGVIKLPSLVDYWSTDKCIINGKIQNAMTRTRFLSILHNFYVLNDHDDDKKDKSNKIRPVIKHPNKLFAESLPNRLFQRVEEHICKFKGRWNINNI